MNCNTRICLVGCSVILESLMITPFRVFSMETGLGGPIGIRGSDGFANGVDGGYVARLNPYCPYEPYEEFPPDDFSCSEGVESYQLVTFLISSMSRKQVLLNFSLPDTVRGTEDMMVFCSFNSSAATITDPGSGEVFYFDPTLPTVVRVDSGDPMLVVIGGFITVPSEVSPPRQFHTTFICHARIVEDGLGESVGIAYSDTANFTISVNGSLPVDFFLYPAYPNPFNPETKLAYHVPREEYVNISIYTLLGEHVGTLVDERRMPGSYEVTWNAGGMPSGIYICRMVSKNQSTFRKLVLLK